MRRGPRLHAVALGSVTRVALLGLVLALAVALAPRSAFAHDFSPGVLVVKERAPGEHDVAWTEPVDGSGAPGGVTLRFPAPCRFAPAGSGGSLSCGRGGLAGVIDFEGMHERRMQVVVLVERLDGTRLERLVTGADPRLVVERGAGRSASTWLRLGVEHILGGFDHLAFVVGLLLVVRFQRRVVATVTAFTAAHSLTLALSALEVVRVPVLPVEGAIAASVVLVAREALHDRATLTRRAPWIVAALFGLVHGLGFASALAEVGLPPTSAGFALLFFNLGVELGQLAVIAALYVMFRALGATALGAKLDALGWPRLALAYALGSLGAYWWLDRLVAIARGG